MPIVVNLDVMLARRKMSSARNHLSSVRNISVPQMRVISLSGAVSAKCSSVCTV